MVTAVFNRYVEQPLVADHMIEPRKTIYLRGDVLYDEHGLVLAERQVDDEGRVFWRPVCRDNKPELVEKGASRKDPWLCPEIAFVGQGRLNL